MGGGAFLNAYAEGQPTLQTPRMQPDDYHRLKALYISRLTEHFPNSKVSSLKEAPEKSDFGDIDIYIATNEFLPHWEVVAKAVGAAGLVDRGGVKLQQCSLAVPMDGAKVSNLAIYKTIHQNQKNQLQASEVMSPESYAQIDVEIVNPDHFEWFIFYASYGDLAGLLGAFVKNFGFTVNDKGFFLRMKELDESKDLSYHNAADAEGMILLSDKPEEVMEFMSLSVKTYESGFETMEAFYSWLAQCKFLKYHAIKREKLNTKDRSKEKRSIFTHFFQEWLPAHRDADSTSASEATLESEGSSSPADTMLDDELSSEHAARSDQTQQQLLEESLAFFNKQDEYTTKHDALVLKRRNDTAAHLLRPLIAQHSGKSEKSITEIVRAFKRCVGIVHSQGDRLTIVEVPHTDVESELHHLLDGNGTGFKDEVVVSAWVKEHWEEVRARERERMKKPQ